MGRKKGWGIKPDYAVCSLFPLVAAPALIVLHDWCGLLPERFDQALAGKAWGPTPRRLCRHTMLQPIALCQHACKAERNPNLLAMHRIALDI